MGGGDGQSGHGPVSFFHVGSALAEAAGYELSLGVNLGELGLLSGMSVCSLAQAGSPFQEQGLHSPPVRGWAQ